MKIQIGTTRIVFIFKKFVIKIPYFLCQYSHGICGIQANLNERKLNGKHPDLAKVLYSSRFGLWLVMEYIKPVDNSRAEELHDYVYSYYKEDLMYDIMISDCKPSNWGIKNNKFIKIDFT